MSTEIVKESYYKVIETKVQKRTGMDKATFSREVGYVIQYIKNNPALLKCDPESVLAATVNGAMVGLTFNPVCKELYLIPRWNKYKKVMEAHLEPSYIGLMKVATDTGAVRSFESHLVYQGDEMTNFDLSTGKGHKPYWMAGNERGSIRGVYSIATLSDGAKHVETMGMDDILDIRDRSDSYQHYLKQLEERESGKLKYDPHPPTWITDEGEMARKTIAKRHFKWLPKSERHEQLDRAIELDNMATGFVATAQQIGRIEGMLDNSTLSDDEIGIIQDKISTEITSTEASNIIEHLALNQRDPIREGGSASAKDIGKAVDNAVNDERK